MRLPARYDATPFHGHGRASFHVKLLFDHMRRAGKDAVRLADNLHKVGRDILRHILMDKRRVFGGGNFEIVDNGQRLILHIDQVERVLGGVATVSDHKGHCLTNIAHILSSKWKLGAWLCQGVMRHQQGRGFQ